MESVEVSSSPGPAIPASDISSYATLYMTDMVIEITSDNQNHCSPTIINVLVFDSEMPGSSNVLVFEKVSARLEWKYDGTLALQKEVTLAVEDSGFVHLTKSKLEQIKESEGSPNQVIQEFITEGDGLQMKLIFSVEVAPPDGNMPQLWDRYPTYEALDQALSEDPEIVLAWALEDPDKISRKPQLLNFIGDTFRDRFLETGTQHDIDNSVLAYKLSVQLLPMTDPDIGEFLHDYGISALERYQLTGNVADINESVLSLRQAVQLTPEDHADLRGRLSNLGISLETRFERTGDLADISEAILSQQKSVQLTPESHANLPSYLSNLGILLRRHFEHTGHLASISEAISSHRKSVRLTPDGHAYLPAYLSNLGLSLQKSFEHTGDLANILEAISFQEKAVQLTPEGHADLAAHLSNLGISLQGRFEHTGNLADISKAMTSHQRSVQLTPERHAYYLAARLNNLGNSLQAHFKHTGDLSGLSEAISSYRKSVQLTPDGHVYLPGRLSNLGIALQKHFDYIGDLADISEAISYQQKSVQLTPEGYADLPGRLNNLALSLQRRYNHTEDLADLLEATPTHQKSVQLTPEGHVNLPIYLSNLALSHQRHFIRTGDLAILSEAILSLRKSVQLTPEGHADLPGRLSNLGSLLQNHFDHTGNLADISEAISSQQKSIQLTPDGHTDLPGRLNNLGVSLRKCFEHTGDLATISEAISSHQKSILLMPDGHAELPAWLMNIGHSFAACYKHTVDAVDVQNAILHYRLSATFVSGPPSIRLAAAQQWAHWAQRADKSQILEAYQIAIPLISQVADLSQTISNRYTNLINMSELSSSAAAAAIDMNRHYLALEWLEQGRSLVWSQLNDLRAPIDDLRTDYPALAKEIVRVSRALENAGSRAEPTAFTPETTMTTKMSIEDEAHTHIKLAQEWDRLLVQVRAIPQFNDFLRPPSYSALLQSIPDSGYVVAINIHQSRSDALILVTGAKEPLHIALPDFPYEKADSLRHDLKALLHDSGIRMRQFEQLEDVTRGSRRHVRGVANILRQLWISVIKPVLDGLGYSTPASKLPRIWWCVTGPLAFLPIHAAGMYAPSESTPGIYTCLSDFAVSSYTPTVRSLVERTQSSRLREIKPKKIGLLMISQPDTPKLARIPGTTIEIKAIKRLLDSQKVQNICLESGEATVDQVKTSMDAYTCIHFACHASQNTTKPLQSGFYLYDGRLELASIIREHLAGADLAFLSACQTSTGDEKLSEEAVHLAGGMLAAGYRGVVATMWSIKDSYGPKLAEEFYKDLLNRAAEDEDESTRFGNDNAARALHYATQQLRKTLDDSESSLLTWVPFVHFGL